MAASRTSSPAAMLIGEAATTFLTAANHALSVSEERHRIEIVKVNQKQEETLAELKATNHSLSIAEERHRKDVAKVNQKREDALCERDALRSACDELLRNQASLSVEAEGHKQEAERWKLALEKAESTIEQKNELITQLLRECQDWKEQFARVESERTRLCNRVDELLSSQLAIHSQSYDQEPMTPRSQGPYRASGSVIANKDQSLTSFSSATNRDDGESGFAEERTDNMPIRKQRTRKQTIVSEQPESPARPRKEDILRSSRQSTLIRKVHAIITVPIKEEEDNDEYDPLHGEGQHRPVRSTRLQNARDTSQPGSSNTRKRKAAVEGELARRRMKETVDVDEGSEASGSDEGEAAISDEDEEDRANVDNGYERKSRRYEDDEDELMIGGEDNRNEVYGSERVLVTPETESPNLRPQTKRSLSKLNNSASARNRSDSTHPNGSNKRARKR